jgi:hypothetical protein
VIRHYDDFPPWILPLQRLGQLKARNAENLNIHEGQVEGVPPGYFNDILRRGAAERITTFLFERLAHQPTERNIVVDDEHPFRSGHIFSYHGASGHAPPPEIPVKAFQGDGWKRTKPNWKIVFATTMVDGTSFILTAAFQMQTLKWNRRKGATGAGRPALPVHAAARVAPRTGRGVERLNEGLDLGLDIFEDRFDLRWIAAGRLVLRHKPGHGIEIDARHLEAKPRAFDQSGPAAHEDVEHPKLAKMAGFLVVKAHIPQSCR